MNKHNVAYICIFLKNSGEKFRAIVLAHDVFGCTLAEARVWLDSVRWARVKIDKSKARKLHKEYPCFMWPEELEDSWEYRISHFPKEPETANPQPHRV